MLLLSIALASAQTAHAAGAYFTNQYMQAAASTERAFISHKEGEESLILSTEFTLNPLVTWNFAWVIAVPSRPSVELINKDVFTDLDRLTRKSFSKDSLWLKLIYPDIREETAVPVDVFSRAVDIDRYEVFAPDKGMAALKDWLDGIGYTVPKTTQPLLEEYFKNKWYLIAAEVNALHIQYQAADSLTVHGAHTLPLKLTFKTDRPVYPLKLVVNQPDLDSQAIPMTFTYRVGSENVLGEKSDLVDSMLSSQSANKYPSLPLDFSNIRIDTYSLAKGKTGILGFTAIFADNVTPTDLSFRDSTGSAYLSLADKPAYLTRLEAYKPPGQMEDYYILPASDSTRVNPRITRQESLVRAGLWLAIALLIIILIFNRLHRLIRSP